MASRLSQGLVLALTLVVLAQLSWAEEDYQQWSVRTYMDEEYTFYCNDTINPIFINADDRVTWRRHGHESDIISDDDYELSAVDGVDNMALTVKKITDDRTGIYFCRVHNSTGDPVGRIVKALNVGGHKYHDYIDKYRTNVVTGVIAGAAVFALVVGACALDNFRYQSEEERAEKRLAKEERLRRLHELKNVGHDNLGMEVSPAGNGDSKPDLNGTFDNIKDEPVMLNTQL